MWLFCSFFFAWRNFSWNFPARRFPYLCHLSFDPFTRPSAEARIPESWSKSEERPIRFVFEVRARRDTPISEPHIHLIYILSSISSHEFEYIKLGKTWRMSLEKRKGNFLVMGNSTGWSDEKWRIRPTISFLFAMIFFPAKVSAKSFPHFRALRDGILSSLPRVD